MNHAVESAAEGEAVAGASNGRVSTREEEGLRARRLRVQAKYKQPVFSDSAVKGRPAAGGSEGVYYCKRAVRIRRGHYVFDLRRRAASPSENDAFWMILLHANKTA